MNLKVWILKMLEYNKDKCRKKKQMNDVAALPRIAQKWCQNFPSVGAATLNFWNHLSLEWLCPNYAHTPAGRDRENTRLTLFS